MLNSVIVTREELEKVLIDPTNAMMKEQLNSEMVSISL
jgi:hypothetical protein